MVIRSNTSEYMEASAKAFEPDHGAAYDLREGSEELDYLLAVVCDHTLPVDVRLKAADKLAPYRHAKKAEPIPVVMFDAAQWLSEVRAMTGGRLPVIEAVGLPADNAPVHSAGADSPQLNDPSLSILGNPPPARGGT